MHLNFLTKMVAIVHASPGHAQKKLCGIKMCEELLMHYYSPHLSRVLISGCDVMEVDDQHCLINYYNNHDQLWDPPVKINSPVVT